MGRLITNKVKLTNIIWNKLGKSIKKATIYDSVAIIFDKIIEDLANSQIVSVKNFGTLSPYIRKSRICLDVASGKIRPTRTKRLVRFRASANFLKLAKLRRASLKRSKSRSKKSGQAG